MINLLFVGLILFSIELKSQSLEDPNTSPVHTLGTIEKDTLKTIRFSSFNPEWVKDLKLLLPCENINLSKRSSRLPNAPRKYRNGTHRGIDFFANWGTNIRAVAPGVVIRADHHYKEYPAKFREQLLQACGIVGHTPSDIFDNVLLGKAVFLDHGFELVPGFRAITIYAHLSHIEKSIKPGYKINAGELIGKSGNTGMRESTIGSKAGSHLHWELILQKDDEEIYLGRNMPNPELYQMLKRIFQ